MAAFMIPERVPGIGLPEAIATVTANPARATGLTDRGALRPACAPTSPACASPPASR